MNLRLQRSPESEDTILGALLGHGFACVTCELGWKANAHKISCIPPGTYTLALHQSDKFGNVWQLLNVPNRDEILIHSGNTVLDTEGCILVGKTFGRVYGFPAVLQSRLTFKKLMNLLNPNAEHSITITA